MRKIRKFSIIMASVFLVCFVAGSAQLSLAQPRQQNPSSQPAPSMTPGPSPAEVSPDSFISIDFNDVEIEVFIKFISELTGKNFIIDRRVKGTISVISPTRISVNEAYAVFESVLDVHGFAAVDAGDVTKIIPSPYARTMNIETRLKEESDSPNDKIVTQLIHLKYADPNEVKQLCAPLVSKSSVVLSYAPTNMLIITDVYSNIKRLINIINAIDVTGIGKEISVMAIQHANAEELSKTIDSVFNADMQAKKGQKDVILVPDKRTNIIIVLASQTGTERVKKLIEMLDQDTPRGNETIHVYYLQNAKAEDLAKVLQEFPTKQQGDADKGKKMAPVISENVKITADKATNTLIIVAEKDDYETLKDIIEKLDVLRSMLYIECLLMEVNKDESLNLGTEWMVGGNASYQDKEGIWGAGFSGGATGGDAGYLQSAVSAGTGQPSLLPPGFSVGVFGEAIQVGNVVFPNIAAVISAYKKDRSYNILSTPQILTTSNEKAKITVGKNVPYLTKASSGDTNYANYEYKDVGISLEVTPQINKDRQIRLEIALEATKLESTTDLFQPTTLKRTITTVVVVNDANTVVIGGLIDDALSSTDYKIPCLGSIPVVGWLFRSMGRAAEQTNLFVFMTPHVLETREEIDAIYDIKKLKIQDIEEGNIKLFKGEGDVSLPKLIMNE